MRTSRVNPDPEYKFNQEIWLISIINTTSGIGHSALVVEGLEKDPLSIYPKTFIGQYDISTIDLGLGEGTCGDSIFVNNKGCIATIKCFENEKNTRNYEEEKYPVKSFQVSAKNAKDMILSIKQEAELVDKASKNRSIRIWNDEHPLEEPKPFHLDAKGLPIESPKFQKFGKDHPMVKLLGDPEAGNNCTGWCLEKLSVAGITHDVLLPKPKTVSGYRYTSESCLIL